MFWLHNIEKDLFKKHSVKPDYIIYHSQKKIYLEVQEKYQCKIKEINKIIEEYKPGDWQFFVIVKIKKNTNDKKRQAADDWKRGRNHWKELMILAFIIATIAFIITKG